MQTKLIEAISQKVQLAPDDIEMCKKYFEHISFAKNEIVEEQDKVPEYLYFIISGFMRLFYYDDNGDEVTTQINHTMGFTASYLRFIHGIKAKENVECITDCELLRISKPNLRIIIDSSENFKIFSLMIFEQAITSAENRANDFATLNAEQRYKKLLNEKPEILQNVPIQYIASFLGMKPESLSRIRRQMNS
jgi:CRP/FNR family transcriptional regulator, anaerobic regulatory protein